MGLYTTLDISKREIRLLRVLPSNDSAEADNANPPICCELSVHRLNYSSTTPYTALSYSWGPELTTPKMLTVNGEAIPARKNLLSALHAFRRRGDVGYVWVDAVCINQDDHEEKKTQIPLMGDIYGLAVQTIIWLGATEGDSDVAMDTLDSLGPGDFEVTRFSEAQCRRWRAVMALLQRSWCKYFSVFPCLIRTRTWVMQEAFLSRKPIAWCGDKELPFERFVTLKELYEASYWKAQAKWFDYPLFQNVPFTTCLSNWKITKTQLARGGDAIFSWIATTSFRLQATEPLDRIYGVLGMCYAEDREAIVADYKASIRNVIIDVVMRSVPTLDLLFLSFVGPDDTRSVTLRLPTWVPDITALDNTQRVNNARDPEHSFNASLGANYPAWTTLQENARLPAAEAGTTSSYNREKELFCLYGCLCDVVTYAEPMPHVSQYMGYDAQLAAQNKAQRARVTIETFRQWEPLATGHSPTTSAPRGSKGNSSKSASDVYAALPGGRKEAFWRSLSCDSAVGGQRPLPQNYGDRYETLMGQRPPPPPLPGQEEQEEDKDFEPMRNDWVRDYAVHAVAKCVNKAFFLTHRGRIGMAVRGVQRDDVVMIARGATVPYVVRRVGDGTFRFVGEAYVHGVMDGEAVEEALGMGWGVIKFYLR